MVPPGACTKNLGWRSEVSVSSVRNPADRTNCRWPHHFALEWHRTSGELLPVGDHDIAVGREPRGAELAEQMAFARHRGIGTSSPHEHQSEA